MSGSDRGKKVVPLTNHLTEEKAWECIHEVLDADRGGLMLSKHARERMEKRDVSNTQIQNVLISRQSQMREGPYQAPNGDWKCTVEGYSAGVSLEIVVAIPKPDDRNRVIVITVIKSN